MLLFIIFFNLIKLIVDIRLIIFLCFGKESLCKILFPTFGVIPKKITEDLYKRVNMFIDSEVSHYNFGKKMIQNKLFLKLNNIISNV